LRRVAVVEGLDVEALAELGEAPVDVQLLEVWLDLEDWRLGRLRH
jgi:hypothetical protein